jgi:hypothetical protein
VEASEAKGPELWEPLSRGDLHIMPVSRNARGLKPTAGSPPRISPRAEAHGNEMESPRGLAVVSPTPPRTPQPFPLQYKLTITPVFSALCIFLLTGGPRPCYSYC